MRVVIVTSMDRGLASLVLPELVKRHSVAGIVKCESTSAPTGGVKRKLKKLLRIGVLGAVNGIRIRPWFFSEPANRLGIRALNDVANELGVPIWSVPFVNSPQTILALRDANADLAISLGNSYIAHRVFSIPQRGMINVHHEILPAYKGAQSIIWQIHAGSRETGYTVHKIDRTIDGGNILYQERRPILFGRDIHETVVASLADVYAASVSGLVNTIDNFDELERLSTPQAQGQAFTTPTIWQFLRIMRQHKRLSSAGAA